MIGEPLSFSLFIPGIPASKGSYRPITGRSRTTGKPVTRLIPMDKKERPWRDHVRDTILKPAGAPGHRLSAGRQRPA